MILRFTVQNATTGVACDVEVVAEPDSTVRSLIRQLTAEAQHRPCFVGALPVDPSATVATCPIVPGCTLSIGAPGPDPRSLPGGTLGALRALGGQDAGGFRWLPAGRHLIGRDPSASLPLVDPRVSREHAELVVSTGGTASLRDTGSKAGTFVDGRRLGSQPVPLLPGARVVMGSTTLEWVVLPAAAGPPVRSRDGRMDFNRAFVAVPATNPLTVPLPADFEPRQNANRFAAIVVALVTPMAMAGVSAYLVHEPVYLLMGLLGPLGLMGNAVVERRQRAAVRRDVARARARVEAEVTAALLEQERRARLASTDTMDLTLLGNGRVRGLWRRRIASPDALVLRAGTGRLPAALTYSGVPWLELPAPVLNDVPVTVDLRAAGVLGLVGPRDVTTALARSLLIQLATLRSPEDLQIVVVTTAEDDDLAWTAWLPHLDAGEAGEVPVRVGNTPESRRNRVGELSAIVAQRRRPAAGAASSILSDIVLLLDGALDLRHLPGMSTVLLEGPAVGVHTIALDVAGIHEASVECAVDADRRLVITDSRAREPQLARAEHLARAPAERMARTLAPLRDRLTLGGAQSAMPYPVRYLALLGIARPQARDVLALWAGQPGPTTSVVLGADGSGPVFVDLAQQGPHTMLGGATGAGKSLLLRTLVTSLLLANRPDELNLVLVDFKGGSAFLPFRDCPHVVSLIRSTGETAADAFDDAAAQRVLASVRTEVRRREALLARYGGEIDALWRQAPGGRAELPRLVMIFDEFARVLDTSPHFLKELVNVAGKGRSLGMHLVLATQSLQGKLSPELKNNIELRITLRQNEIADSVEVLGVPDAATIPGRLRGRGMILSTKDEARTPRTFQSGYLGDPPPAGGATPAPLRPLTWTDLGAARPREKTAFHDRESDQELTIAAINAAAGELDLPAPFRPLLPPLPPSLGLAELGTRVTAPIASTAVPFGLRDVPEAQQQPAAVLDLAGTDRLLVAGGPQSGRTSFLASLLAELVRRFDDQQAHFYVIERDRGGLSAFAAAAQCGGVFAADEPDRVRRFVTWLEGEVDRRADRRRASPPRPAWIVVAIDGWAQFEDRTDPTFQEGSLLTALRAIIAAGPPVGVHVVATGGQELIGSKLSAVFSQRVLLSFPKEDIRRAYLPTTVLSPPVLPGRAVDAGNGQHLQVARPPEDLQTWLRSRPDARPGSGDRGDERGPERRKGPLTFPPLPVSLRLGDVPGPPAPLSAAWMPLGIGGPALEPVGLDLFDGGPNLLLVSGTSGSGRSTAAMSVIDRLRAAAVGVILIAPARSALHDQVPEEDGVKVIAASAVKDVDLRAGAEAFGEGRYAVVIDDCDQVTVEAGLTKYGAEEPTLLVDLVATGARGRRALVICGDIQPILLRRRPSLHKAVSEMAASGWRLVLCPATRNFSRDHGLDLEPDQRFSAPAGRGYLLQGGGAEPMLVQLARR